MNVRPALFLALIGVALTAGACQKRKTSSYGGGGAPAAGEKPSAEPNIQARIDEEEKKPTLPEDETQQPSVPAEKPEEECYKADAETCAIEMKILELVNAERAAPSKGFQRNPLPAFANGKKMGFIARDWSAQMAKRGNIGHDGFPNQRMRALAQEFGGSGGVSMFGENVAMTYGGETNVAEELYRMWYNSGGHYANMMSRQKAIGIGVAKKGDSWYATQLFGAE